MFTVISSSLMSPFGLHRPSEFYYCLSRAGQLRSTIRFSIHLKSYYTQIRWAFRVINLLERRNASFYLIFSVFWRKSFAQKNWIVQLKARWILWDLHQHFFQVFLKLLKFQFKKKEIEIFHNSKNQHTTVIQSKSCLSNPFTYKS